MLPILTLLNVTFRPSVPAYVSKDVALKSGSNSDSEGEGGETSFEVTRSTSAVLGHQESVIMDVYVTTKLLGTPNSKGTSTLSTPTNTKNHSSTHSN